MARRGKKSWKDKLEKAEGLPKVVDVPEKMQKRLGKGKMLIPHPKEVDNLVKRVGWGKLATQDQIRNKLAEQHRADVTCPITTGIFMRIVAEAAEEDFRSGKEEVTPYWRVVGKDGSLNPKFPGGVEAQAARLEREGHVIEWKRSKAFVKDFEKHLATL